MVQLVVGQKGKGKTTQVLGRANEEIKTARGNIVFIDRNSAHMYELNNKIRLIDISRYPLANSDEFVGFINGIISHKHSPPQRKNSTVSSRNTGRRQPSDQRM